MAELMENEELINEESEDTTKDLYLTFQINDEDYAIEVVNIKEIITMSDITVVPKTPDFLKGIINLRGDIVPVICVRSRFGLPKMEYDDSTCIIVLDYGEYIIGLIVDMVNGVLTIPEENISLPPSAKLNHTNQFVKNVGKTEEGVKLLLDIDRVLF